MEMDATFTHFPQIITSRLLLREIKPADAEALFATFSDEETMQFYGHEPHHSLDDSRQLIARIQTNYAQRKGIQWGITLHGEERVIGSCSLHHINLELQRAEIGYELNRSFWRQGIMFEAASAILTYGFTELGLHRIEAIIDDANARSKGLLLKLGFTYEGNLRQRYYFRGHFEDEHYFGLLKDEWHPIV